MLYVNFKAYNSYETDSLYQWDINQKLNIVGLGLSEAPEVHFANANMERAIVRPAIINGDTITVDIPNSILQEPLPIKAYIGIYEGETFKVIESIKIPVIPKERPTDYKFEDDGGDIYSYNEILNKMLAFENKYGEVDLGAVRNYEAWVANVLDLKTRVETAEGALENNAKIVSGSYDGVVTQAENYIPVQISLPFAPKILLIKNITTRGHWGFWVYGSPIFLMYDGSSATYKHPCTVNGNIIEVGLEDSVSASDSVNFSNNSFVWVAVG